MPRSERRVIVIGGGNGGLEVAGRLRSAGVDCIDIVEPRSEHLYKPLFSHIAGGTATRKDVIRDEAMLIPAGVGWINDSAVSIRPEENIVVLATGATLNYSHLIVAPGIQMNWAAVPGLIEALKTPYVSSSYELEFAVKTSSMLRDIRRGTVIFSQADGPTSCAGAIQKPMYQACAYWRALGVLDNLRVMLLTPNPTVFGVREVDEELDRKIAEYGIELRTGSTVTRVDASSSVVHVAVGGGEEDEVVAYDALIIEPPQSAPDWLAATVLADPSDPSGFVEVDPRTLRHRRYTNVWSVGDAAGTKNSKSGGALRKQTQVVAKNLVSALAGREPSAYYNGYSVCPLTVSRSTVVFAEFDERHQPMPTIPFWRASVRESRLMWWLDRRVMPWMYWHMILRGRA